MKAVLTISLHCISNIFMTMAWYGHLKYKDMEWSKSLEPIAIFLIFTLLFFWNEKIAWNHLVGFGFLILAVYFIFLNK